MLISSKRHPDAKAAAFISRRNLWVSLDTTEGFVTGMAAKMFTVAGPVIVFGTLASAIYGVILMLLGA